jgi:acyl-CoA hydrolase
MIKRIEMKEMIVNHLVKGEDLNHHKTLFAGRTAEWFVESGFIAAAAIVDPKDIICLKIHGMTFNKPVKAGNIVCFRSKVVYAGRTSLTSFVKVSIIHTENEVNDLVDGYITFVHVDEHGKPLPHNLEIIANTEEDKAIQEEVKSFKK